MRLLLIITCFFCAPLCAGWQRVGEVWSNTRYAPTLPVQEHFDAATQYVQEKQWDEALDHYMVIVHHFQQTPFFADSLYHVALCYYYLGHFDLADQYFSRYLNLNGTLKYFEKVFEYKYNIAENYREGRRKHLLGYKSLPRIVSGKGNAVVLYNEVVAALPSRDVAAQALTSKAALLYKTKEYKESIETLQTLIRRFPKHYLAAEGYLVIGEIYLTEIKREAQNPDLIALAHVNMQRFSKSFPGDERRAVLETHMAAMQEVCANSLYETARFYERIKRPKASIIYYNDTIHRFPHTPSAQRSQERLERLAQ